jgi:hypothetical protein
MIIITMKIIIIVTGMINIKSYLLGNPMIKFALNSDLKVGDDSEDNVGNFFNPTKKKLRSNKKKLKSNKKKIKI